MFKRIFLVILFSVIYSGKGSVVPFIKKCNLDDSKCIKETTQEVIPIFAAGIKDLGVETLDPLYIKSLDASSSGLKLYMKDLRITGLKDAVVKKIQYHKEKPHLIVKLMCNVDIVNQYEMSGQLLILPIQGKGGSHVVLRKLVITAEADIGEVGKDGAKHWVIKDWSHSYSLKDKATMQLENLFEGNEVLGRAARDFIEASSNEIIKEFGPPIVKAVATKIIDNLKNFFQNVPVEDLVL